MRYWKYSLLLRNLVPSASSKSVERSHERGPPSDWGLDSGSGDPRVLAVGARVARRLGAPKGPTQALRSDAGWKNRSADLVVAASVDYNFLYKLNISPYALEASATPLLYYIVCAL